MYLKFNETMNTEFDSSLINDTNIDIYIKPAMGRDQELSFDMHTVNLTWDVISFENDTLEISLNFSKPLEISPMEIQDTLVFHITEGGREFFYSKES